jgi:1,2-dihydroxy-3-keto-5-methylthiopentene dioxygenase
MRLFKDQPKWTPIQRGEDSDANPYRKDYLKTRDGALDSVPDSQRMT